ncbi:MAG TPA: DNA polymerase III subunit delta [Candidatus Saccharimonadales bacterium]|nr:DNA polymerase III subunit delta [Candidatus Saccharimonadales bacterium]
MTITLAGNNFYLIKRRMDELTSKFVKEHGELAVDKIDAEEAESAAILEAVQSLPFLASRKLVVIRNLSANKPAAEQIEQIISSAGDGTDVIFYEPSPDKRTVFYKVLKRQTELQEYNELDARELSGWLVLEAKKLGGKISPADANYLVERLGANQELLANELDKLLTYDPSISRDNIDRLTVKNPQSKVFDLLDAMFSNRKKLALELYDEQRAQKVEPQAIIAMMAWQLDLIALSLYGKGKDANQIAKDAGVSPYPVMKAQRLAAKLDEAKLKQMVRQALIIDEMGKTTPLDLDEALKTYIVTL